MERMTADRLLAAARERIAPRLAPEQAAAAVEQGALLIDVRSRDERERAGVIPGSLHIPRSVLEWRLDPESGWANPHVGGLHRQLILTCAEGCSSSFAAATALDLGYERATDLAGGFAAWEAAGLPVRACDTELVDPRTRPGLGPPEPTEPVTGRKAAWLSR